ncbi:MAG: flavin reductase family protein [Thermodesulfobacteriota bacterium]
MKKVRIAPGPFVLPMPTVLVGAAVDGAPNFMTVAFAGLANYQPPIVAISVSPDHYTTAGIRVNGTFSINLPGPDLVEATDWCGIHSGKKVDKSKVFETFSGELENAPMIEACRLTAECRLVRTVELKMDVVFFGEVVSVHVDESALKDGDLDWQRIAPLIFTFPDKGYWRIGERVADAWSVGKKFKG